MKWNENNQVFLQSGRFWNEETLIFIEKQYISGLFSFFGSLFIACICSTFLFGRERMVYLVSDRPQTLYNCLWFIYYLLHDILKLKILKLKYEYDFI